MNRDNEIDKLFKSFNPVLCFAAGLSIGIGLMAVVVLMPDGLYSNAEYFPWY